jgi:hypothetical protein
MQIKIEKIRKNEKEMLKKWINIKIKRVYGAKLRIGGLVIC